MAMIRPLFLGIPALLSSGAWAQRPLLENLAPGRLVPADGDVATDLVLGDVDGDGAPDLVIGSVGGFVGAGSLRLATNDGHGLFIEVEDAFDEHDRTGAQGLADVDEDGDLDLFVAENGGFVYDPELLFEAAGAQNRLYLNDGSGGFADATANLPAVEEHSTDVALADFDGDGHVDALVGAELNCNRGCTETALYLGDGAGAFGGPILPDHNSLFFERADSLSVADVDGDGDVDAVFKHQGAVLLYRNLGAGLIRYAPGGFPAGDTRSYRVALGDVDGDGDQDAFSGEHYYENDGAGTFTDHSGGVPSFVTYIADVVMADVNGDGELDALLAHDGDHPNQLYLGDGTGAFADAPGFPADSTDTRAVLLGDVDLDGDADALLANAGQNRLYLGDGAGSFVDTEPDLGLGLWPGAADAGLSELNGDGRLDAYLAVAGQNRLMLGTGDGDFIDASGNLPAVSDVSASVAVADVDADGDMDALIGIAGVPNAPDVLQRNDGTGVFTTDAGALPVFSERTLAVALGDVDGDCDADAVVATGFGQTKRLLLNDGTGVFQDASADLPADADRTHLTVDLSDFDGDGSLDVLLSAGDLFLNDGYGVFSEAATPGSFGGGRAAVGDMDQDGDDDVFFPNDGTGRLFRNDGGTMVQQTFFNFSEYTYCAAFGDIDGDGDNDLLIGARSASNEKILMLKGNGPLGNYVNASDRLRTNTREDASAIVFGDVDDDGDLDALVCQTESSRIWKNLSLQLVTRGFPRIGRPLGMELYGPPGRRWLIGMELELHGLAHGLSAAPRTGLLYLEAGTLDGEGRASRTYEVPDAPSLVGETLVWRARIGKQLTSRVTTTVAAR